MTDANQMLSFESDEDDDEAQRQRQLGVLEALMFVGADHSQRKRSECRHARHTYLVRGDLLPNSGNAPLSPRVV
jgi:hypothetical protein